MGVAQSTITPIAYQHPIPYAPKQYVCYRSDTTLIIDGKLDEAIWQQAPATDNFVDIEGNLKPLPTYATNVKMLWDDDYFYLGAYLKEPHIWAKLTERDAVIFYDNDFEIFLDPDGDTHNYYEFEVNAFNTVWDLLILRPYREDGAPKVLNHVDMNGLKSAVFINGTINDGTDTDKYWTVEVAIPWKVLNEMAPKAFLPKDGVQWRVNFSRVNWRTEFKNGEYIKKLNPVGKPFPEQ
ncbi:MAG: carbohydrate-binding family 9-like protein, partial [Bacteroidota bacterium]